MTRTDDDFEDKLARLAAETDALHPRADFTRRVMAAVENANQSGDVRSTGTTSARDRVRSREAPRSTPANADWSFLVLRWAKLGMAVASLAAAACVFFAWDTANAADQEEAVAYGMTEAFE